MNTVRRLIYGEILVSVGFVLLAFLSLFFFFDFVDELPALGKPSVLDPSRVYGLRHALLYVGLLLPSRVYELMPIAVLIGAVYALVRLAQASEYTILRTSGLGPWRALRALLGLGLFFVLLTFAIGDYLAPAADRTGQLLKAQFQGRISVGQTGAWLKERQDGAQFSVNVRAMDASGALEGIRIFAFDPDGRISATLNAQHGVIDSGAGQWRLSEVQRRRFDLGQDRQARTDFERLDTLVWPTGLNADMVSVALLKPERMRTVDLFGYIQHLQANNQTAQRYEIEFWRKVFYPLSCLVMVVLALPFAYLHFRASGLAAYVFAGVMIGISFFLLNNVFGYIGNLRDWQPWLAAAAPSMLYSLASLGAFGWLVLKR
ncbi:LPS export ABC transporter permease LptG [Aquabacterium sp. A08]|uniref:LPS export ABC transporter permease LptG n=1 Tax=Aquabacterium sp. A08 TaxID=2718532 RepID=UPI001423B531|nr:LPS export ABC transporter permease LptG [Aquabacterium sp. A08]NIC43389.1 LPS export ABC transporter permease LptG [Aquabacterium sp. A08]